MLRDNPKWDEKLQKNHWKLEQITKTLRVSNLICEKSYNIENCSVEFVWKYKECFSLLRLIKKTREYRPKAVYFVIRRDNYCLRVPSIFPSRVSCIDLTFFSPISAEWAWKLAKPLSLTRSNFEYTEIHWSINGWHVVISFFVSQLEIIPQS